jgi:hypothetical protein
MANTPSRALPLILEETYVRQDDQGRFSLNDLHQAAGGEDRHKPGNWLQLVQTQALIQEISNCADLHSWKPIGAIQTAGIPALTAGIPAVKKSEGRTGGTYAVRELVYAYAMWISPAFHLKVIRTFDAVVTGKPGPAIQSSAPVGKHTGMPTTQLIALQDHSWKLVERLKVETGRELREAIYQQLVAVFHDLGQTAPPLDAIGQTAPEASEMAREFWVAVEALERMGHPVNHSRNPELIALNLKQVCELAEKEHMMLAPLGALKKHLRACRSPRFVDVKTVNSQHAGVTIHAWVFQAQKGGAA